MAVKYKIYGLRWSIYLTLNYLYRLIIYQLLQKSYSQYGEDLIIEKKLGNKKNLFYVDIGANHPIKFNNTYHFYLFGSRGINIEPNNRLLNLFKKYRPNDINLNIGISDKNSSLKFYNLYPDVNSTFSHNYYLESIDKGSVLLNIKKVKVFTLKHIFDKYVQNNKIDVLSIDTESHDLIVLKSNDWTKYRPTIICIETLTNNGVNEYLTQLGYRKTFQNKINSIYVNL